MNNREIEPQIMPPLMPEDHVRGVAAAPYILMEYANFQCPQSIQAYGTIKSLQARFGERFCFVFRHFPLTDQYPQSPKAAEVAEAAGAQGKFWEMHDLLFQQAESLGDGALISYANQLDLNIEQVLQELADHVHTERIQADVDSGDQYGVKKTPTFFIAIRHEGDQDLEMTFLKLLQEICYGTRFST